MTKCNLFAQRKNLFRRQITQSFCWVNPYLVKWTSQLSVCTARVDLRANAPDITEAELDRSQGNNTLLQTANGRVDEQADNRPTQKSEVCAAAKRNIVSKRIGLVRALELAAGCTVRKTFRELESVRQVQISKRIHRFRIWNLPANWLPGSSWFSDCFFLYRVKATAADRQKWALDCTVVLFVAARLQLD